MKKYLLPENGNFYKANLHCHTTVSDGRLTPEGVKELYKSQGYSVVAYTDHNLLISHNDLTDSEFLALNGVELDVGGKKIEGASDYSKVCHFCLIALEPDNHINPFWHRSLYKTPGNVDKNAKYALFDDSKPDYMRTYTSECISEIMSGSRELGFFVTYNHPTWSRESYDEYMGYHGMHAVEMFNGSCIAMGYDEYNPRVYEDILSAGQRIYAIGADDNHNVHPFGSRRCDSCVAFTMIKAESLDYQAVTGALLDGHFYASEGPEIYELTYDEGKIHIETSLADRITVTYLGRGSAVAYSDETPITSADFNIPANVGYFRLTVTDRSGKRAVTNAYYLDELMK